MMIVTIAALLMAASLAWFAYRLLQEEQRRSDARVAILTAALESDSSSMTGLHSFSPAQGWPAPAPRHTGTNGSSPATATRPVSGPDIVMLEDDSRNVRAFRSEHDVPRPRGIVDSADVLRPNQVAAPVRDEEVEPLSRPAGLFADAPVVPARSPRALVAVVAVLLVGLLAVGYALFAPGTDAEPAAAAASSPASRPVSANPVSAGGVPLELTALSHAQSKGVLVVRGSVRNPVAGSNRQGVVAHVALLDAAGVIVASADAPLASGALGSGRGSTFQVRLASTPEMRRYRVTFRDATGTQVEHLDRRGAK